jgi:hypothetical protein
LIDSLAPRESYGPCLREVGVIERYLIGTFAADHDLELVRIGPGGVHLVVDGNRLIHRGQRMVSISTRSTHLEGEVDLGRDSHAYASSDRRRR